MPKSVLRPLGPWPKKWTLLHRRAERPVVTEPPDPGDGHLLPKRETTLIGVETTSVPWLIKCRRGSGGRAMSLLTSWRCPPRRVLACRPCRHGPCARPTTRGEAALLGDAHASSAGATLLAASGLGGISVHPQIVLATGSGTLAVGSSPSSTACTGALNGPAPVATHSWTATGPGGPIPDVQPKVGGHGRATRAVAPSKGQEAGSAALAAPVFSG